MLKLCTISGALQNHAPTLKNILNHLKVIWELQCAEWLSHPWAVWALLVQPCDYSREGFLLFVFWEDKVGATQIFLEKSKLPGE